MKTIIAGSRDITDYYTIEEGIQSCNICITEVVSGGARGIDSLGEQWARLRDIPVKRFPADWNKHGKAAGPIRNKQMVEYADALIAFHKNDSRGTADMIKRARERGLKVFVINVDQ